MTDSPNGWLRFFRACWFGPIWLMLLAACSPDANEPGVSLLKIRVESEQLIAPAQWPRPQAGNSMNASANILLELAQLWPVPNAKNSVMTYSKTHDGQGYTAILIVDEVVGDDSVSGYRYQLGLKKVDSKWIIVEAKKSWRCWPDRGHKHFSIQPCV